MPRLYIGTNGLSVWTSNDLGQTLTRTGSGRGMYSGSQVWALAPCAAELLAGTNSGIYRLDRAATRWSHVPSPMDNMLVTALAVSPHDPQIILAGTQPAALYRSDDRGEHWRNLGVAMKPYTTVGFEGAVTAAAGLVKHWTRATQILFDPKDRAAVWAGVEIDGAWRSTDGGEHWERMSQGLTNDDIHGFAIAHDDGRRLLFATTYLGLHTSGDGGVNWKHQPIDSAWPYVRSIVERPDAQGVMFMTNGDGPPGSHGRLWRSRDYGAHWEDANLPGEVESSVYFLAVNAADPNLIFAAATLGQLYRSTVGGETWTALKRRLGEIRALAWLPD